MRPIPALVTLLALAAPALGGSFEVTPVAVTEWKPVYGQVETRDRVPARARIGGTVATLRVTEGDRVEAGAVLATIEDVKLDFRIDALEAQLDALGSRLQTARADLVRGEALIERGVITSQRLEALRTDVSVIEGEMSSVEAERAVVRRQIEEGRVLAPDAGIVLSVPLSRGSVVTPGEAVAEIGGGGVFLRLAVPERHAADLSEGATIEIGGEEGIRTGVLARLYPLIEGGRVQADVEVEGLDPRFIGRRLPVRLPVSERMALLVPQSALSREGGLDYVAVSGPQGAVRRVVVPGARHQRDGREMREILSGLAPGEVVVTGDD